MLGMSDHEIDGHSTWKWSEDTRDRKTLSPVLLLKNIFFTKIIKFMSQDIVTLEM